MIAEKESQTPKRETRTFTRKASGWESHTSQPGVHPLRCVGMFLRSLMKCDQNALEKLTCQDAKAKLFEMKPGEECPENPIKSQADIRRFEVVREDDLGNDSFEYRVKIYMHDARRRMNIKFFVIRVEKVEGNWQVTRF